MVDPVDNSFNSLQRIQQLALANLKANQKVVQALVSQTQQSTAVVPVKFTGVPQTSKSIAFALPKTPPPRGTFVDKLV
jgi:hypothetical protein